MHRTGNIKEIIFGKKVTFWKIGQQEFPAGVLEEFHETVEISFHRDIGQVGHGPSSTVMARARALAIPRAGGDLPQPE